jgi:hypothetical protein
MAQTMPLAGDQTMQRWHLALGMFLVAIWVGVDRPCRTQHLSHRRDAIRSR